MTAYATLAQVKAALRITDSVDDTLLEMARVSASDLIDGYTGRTFTTSGTVTRVFAPADDYVLQTDDLAGTAVTITSSTGADGVFDVTWKTTDYQLEPLNGVSNGQAVPFTRIRAIQDYLWPTAGGEATVRVTGVYGFPSVPLVISQATVLQSSRIFTRLQSPLGIAGFGEMGVVRVTRALDPDVAALVEPYRRIVGVA
jgi:Phage gp6-like head-tail connector protein